jgi:site-specific DNA-methyltransferase (adenine-specific)
MQLAALPEQDAQRVAHLSLRKAAKVLARKRCRRIAEGNGSPLPPELRFGDFRKVLSDIPPDSVDVILTDPFWHDAHVSLYGDLAIFAKRVLKPSGWLLAYSGNRRKPDYIALLGQQLQHGLEVVCVQLRGPSLLLHGSDVINRYRPILGYFKPPRRPLREPIIDVIIREDRPEKQWHPYQQQLRESIYLINKFSEPGDLIVDPFAGSGTTVVASRASGPPQYCRRN